MSSNFWLGSVSFAVPEQPLSGEQRHIYSHRPSRVEEEGRRARHAVVVGHWSASLVADRPAAAAALLGTEVCRLDALTRRLREFIVLGQRNSGACSSCRDPQATLKCS